MDNVEAAIEDLEQFAKNVYERSATHPSEAGREAKTLIARLKTTTSVHPDLPYDTIDEIIDDLETQLLRLVGTEPSKGHPFEQLQDWVQADLDKIRRYLPD